MTAFTLLLENGTNSTITGHPHQALMTGTDMGGGVLITTNSHQYSRQLDIDRFIPVAAKHFNLFFGRSSRDRALGFY